MVTIEEDRLMIKQLVATIVSVSFVGAAIGCVYFCSDELKELNIIAGITEGSISTSANENNTEVDHFHFNKTCNLTCNIILASCSSCLKETTFFSFENDYQCNFIINPLHSRIFRPPIS